MHLFLREGDRLTKLEARPFQDENELQRLFDDQADLLRESLEERHVIVSEFETAAGPADLLGVDASGNLALGEAKLYHNSDRRRVVAQAIDYAAQLSNYGVEEFIDAIQAKSGRDVVDEWFDSREERATFRLALEENLRDGRLTLYILMDQASVRLRDSVRFLNRSTAMSCILAEVALVEMDDRAIVAADLYGHETAEDRDARSGTGTRRTRWTREEFLAKLAEHGQEEVNAARAILEWGEANGIDISWSESKRGSFILSFQSDTEWFSAFSVHGGGLVEWNAPRQGDEYSPPPFDRTEQRLEILKRLGEIPGVSIDAANVDGFSALHLPLSVLAEKGPREQFFEVCTWIKDALEARAG